MKDLLLFGTSGQIGSGICDFFVKKRKSVVGVARDKNSCDGSEIDVVEWDVFNQDAGVLKKFEKFQSVCFAQGKNINDSIYNFNLEDHLELYRANCLYVISAINKLIEEDLLAKEAKICVISSIWQNIARQDKMSYCVTKSALQGLINSLSIDLAARNYLINAILPGALDTEMTRSNLSPEQLNKLQQSTFFDRLANIDDVSSLAYFLCSEENKGITGQFINVDLGFSNARIF